MRRANATAGLRASTPSCRHSISVSCCKIEFLRSQGIGTTRSGSEPWRLVLGYGRERRWRKIVLRLSLLSFFLAPVSCYVAEYRRAIAPFDAIPSPVQRFDAAVTAFRNADGRPNWDAARTMPEAGLGVVDPGGTLQQSAGNAGLLYGIDFAHERTIAAAESLVKRTGRYTPVPDP